MGWPLFRGKFDFLCLFSVAAARLLDGKEWKEWKD